VLLNGAEGHVFLPLFGKTIELLVNGLVEQSYLEACVEFLTNLPQGLFEELTSEVGSLSNVEPVAVTIWQPGGSDLAFSMEFDTKTDPEHGAEWRVLGGRQTYFGTFEGGDPWDDL
jgi:hypothetical protein